MSDEKEIEVVAGTITGVTLKREGTWVIEVKPEGSQYGKNLWTKNKDGKDAAEALLNQKRWFVCSASYWTNNEGKQVRSLWVDRMTAEEPEGVVSTPKPATGGRGRSPEDTRSIIRQSCLKAAATLYQGRTDATSEHVIGAAVVFEQWVLREDPKPEVPVPDAREEYDANLPKPDDIPF